jgi:HEAT repeat protein
LEFTLKVWAAYAGDALGPDAPHSIEAYLRRMTIGLPNARPALENIAHQMILTANSVVTQKEAEAWVAEYDVLEAAESEALAQAKGATKKKTPIKNASRLLPALIANGLFVPHQSSRLSFYHPMLLGYLAGSGLAKVGDTGNIQYDLDWIGNTLTMRYMACFSNVANLVGALVGSQRDDPLRRGILATAYWVRTAPKNAPWRGTVLRSLASILQKEHPTLGLSGRALVAMATTGDPGLPSLFRQLLISDQPNLRQLGALGCGLTHDTKAVNDLVGLLDDSIPSVGRAACLALMAIGNKTAMDSIVNALLQGSEQIRQTAAEVLAVHPEEGHPTLEEGSTVDDLLVRHAIVFGLARVNQPWAIQLLEKMAIEDGQWVVRNAAAQALEELKQPNPRIPQRLPPLHELPWLINFAALFGMGVTPGEPALEILAKALKEGDDARRMAALNYIRFIGGEDFIVQIYNLLYGGQGEMREAALNTLWHMAASGITLPSPVQFGLG